MVTDTSLATSGVRITPPSYGLTIAPPPRRMSGLSLRLYAVPTVRGSGGDQLIAVT
jgi:hypothetical protein